MAHELKELPLIAPRKTETHKGTYGRISIIGGSFGMAGAVVLAGRGAVRSGAGLTDCVVPERIGDIVSVKADPCLMVKTLPSADDGTFSSEASKSVLDTVLSSTVLAAGPGIRTSSGARFLINEIISETDAPLVLDADGLNCLALEGLDILEKRRAPAILTPHPGEMSRLVNMPAAEIQEHRVDTAVSFARTYSCVVVLKGAETVVADGETCYINPTGNPGMAAGGSGDVLTGIIAGILSSTALGPFEAACAGVWVHGTAGDLGAERKGRISLVPEDICEFIPNAFMKYPSC